MRHRAWLLALLVVASLGVTPAARADGGLFVEVVDVGPTATQAEVVADGRLSSNLQRALYVASADGCWDSYVQPGTIAVAGAAWILPLPGVPIEIAEDAEGVLEQIDAATRPVLRTETQRVRIVEHEGGHMGLCGGTAASGGVDQEPVADPETRSDWPLDPVWVRAAGSIGAVDYEVLTAASADDLAAWLEAHGYAHPDGLAERAEPYVQRGWAFFAARVRNDAAEARALPTFRFRHCDLDDFVPVTYPMRLTTLSMGEALDFLILIAGTNWTPYAGDASRGNWQPVTAFETHRDGLSYASAEGEGGCSGEPLGPRYDANLESLLGREVDRDGDERAETALVRQYMGLLHTAGLTLRAALDGQGASSLADRTLWTAPLEQMVTDGAWVTRWRGRATPASMDVDVVFEPFRTPYLDDGVLTEYCVINDETGEQIRAWDYSVANPAPSARDARQAGSVALMLGATLLGLAVRRGRR